MDSNLNDIRLLYEASLAKHGAAPQGVGWRDEESQRLRFDKLIEVIDPSSGPYVINDLGCGYGAFCEHLIMRNVPVSRFRGYDISSAMIAQARNRVHMEAAEFIQSAAIKDEGDYGFACGIFNVRMSAPEDEWLNHILQALDNIYETSRRGFAFNLLTSYVDWKEPHLFYGDPRYFFDYCKRKYSRYVTLLHNYKLWEWTILVWRQGK